MSLVHNKVVVTPDQPGFEVDATEYNAEHKFPGAGAGEVVFVDASGHAATSADFTFDAASKTLGIGGNLIRPSAEFSGTDALDFSGPALAPLPLITHANYTDASNHDLLLMGFDGSQMWVESVSVGTETTKSLSVGTVYQGGGGNWIQFYGNQSSGQAEIDFVLDDGEGASRTFYLIPDYFAPATANVADLGAEGNEWRTGYFGTSVSSPLFVAAGVGNGITTTVTTASLVGKTITITGGIITGFA